MLIELMRILLVFALSFIFGMDRQRAHKPTGFGTFIFVATGACALAITALSLAPENPLPLMSATVTGIGFLGAGALIRQSDRIFGFTTAAAIWAFAIFGLLIGTGEYFVGLVLYVVVWGAILYDRYLEIHGTGSYRRRITITTSDLTAEKAVDRLLKIVSRKYTLIGVEAKREDKTLVLTYLVEGRKSQLNSLPTKLSEYPWFAGLKVE